MTATITTEGRALIRHRDGRGYRASEVELRNRQVIAVAQRLFCGEPTEPPTRYAWPAGHVTVRWHDR